MKQLPDDLEAMEPTELAEQRALRDDLLAPLFRRWPALSRLELGRLRRMYTERLRIARFLGRRRVHARSYVSRPDGKAAHGGASSREHQVAHDRNH